MAVSKVNLARGDTYIPGDGWTNFDYVATSPILYLSLGVLMDIRVGKSVNASANH